MPKLFQPKKEKSEKKEKKKSNKRIEKDEKLKKVTEKLADNPEVVKMIQEENEESSARKSKKDGKKKLFKIIIPTLLIFLLIGGGGFFVLKSGIFFGNPAANQEDNSVDKAAIYIQAETFYSEGRYFDASALFSFLGEYEDSKEMLTKIDLNKKYPDNGSKISEYIGSDVINNYILSYKNYSEIATELENATKKTDAAPTTTSEESLNNQESGQPTKKSSSSPVKEKIASNATAESTTTTENTSSEKPTSTTPEDTSSSSEPAATKEKTTEEKIEYDEAVVQAVKERTHDLIIVGNLVKSLNLSNDNILYDAHETLKRSADYSNQAAEKILEGVEAGTYKPGGTSEVSKEVAALIENMNNENTLFTTQIEEIIGSNILLIIKHPNAGELMNRYSESIYVFYTK